MNSRIFYFSGITMLLFITNGCSSAYYSQIITEHLQTISAGHTGCLPQDNDITVITMGGDGSGVWTAVCMGKRYLCSSAGGTNGSSYSCAPAVK